MRHIVAPAPLPDRPSQKHMRLFAAGGITDCPDWQRDYVQLLDGFGIRIDLFNPRRPNFDVRDPNASEEQIEWEHRALHAADVISFWFPEETLCPITLYELGFWSATDKPIIVGCHPNYARRYDVEKQTSLCRPEVPVVHTLRGLTYEVLKHMRELR